MRSAVAGLLLALTACSGSTPPTAAPSPVPPPPSPSPSPSAPPTTARCENPEGGYALSYPLAWSVADGEGIEPCTFFDPAPLALEPGTEATGVTVRADVRDVPLAQARRDTGGVQEDRTAGGLAAVRATGTYDDDPLLPPGTGFTTWLVDLGGRTLLLTTDTAARTEDHAGAVEVLDAMAQTVERV